MDNHIDHPNNEKSLDRNEESFGPRDYTDPPPAHLIEMKELRSWGLYRAVIVEFVATLLLLYITIGVIIGNDHQNALSACGVGGVGILGIAWSFGGMIFILVYCTAGISGNTSSVTLSVCRAFPSVSLEGFYRPLCQTISIYPQTSEVQT